MSDHATLVKNAADGGAAVVAFSGVLGYMPEIASTLAVVWYLLRAFTWAVGKMGETHTPTAFRCGNTACPHLQAQSNLKREVDDVSADVS
jgi:hypothetical protein